MRADQIRCGGEREWERERREGVGVRVEGVTVRDEHEVAERERVDADEGGSRVRVGGFDDEGKEAGGDD